MGPGRGKALKSPDIEADAVPGRAYRGPVDIDLPALLSLPAAERLELAEILRRSVGCPPDLESLALPEWQQEHFDRILRRAGGPRAG